MCLCCIDHPAAFRGRRACRLTEERTKGVVWNHASFNLVKPRAFRTGRGRMPRLLPEIGLGVSTGHAGPQLRLCANPGRTWIIYH
jgi:hypothetical protein